MPFHSIVDLPNETLLRIFHTGCEEQDREPVRSCPRRPKQFAGIIRQINRHWKALIDFEPLKLFWVVHLNLTVVYSPHDHKSKGGWLIRDLAIFRRLLLTSEGCHLMIGFRLHGFNDLPWDNPIMSLPEAAITTLRLVHHAIEWAAPYQNQVLSFKLMGYQPHLYAHVLDLISRRWRTAPRLVEIWFELESQTMQKTISER